MVNRLAAIALTVAALFLMVMAVLVNSPPLFYMATAVIATLAASRLQAWLAVRGLSFERSVPPAVKVGEIVSISVTVWSRRKIQRPLVTIVDDVPKRLAARDVTPSIPVAPAFDQPIQTSYRFRPMRRGRYRWSGLTVFGTDALGLVTTSLKYATDVVELTVYPAPVPIFVDLVSNAGWGPAELETGRAKGSGMEPSGTREYVAGDPLRHIHWAASARTNRLMVKEHESGAGSLISCFLQRTDVVAGPRDGWSPFEAACAHALFLATDHVRRGGSVVFPQMEDLSAAMQSPELRERNLREVLTDIQPGSHPPVAEEVARQVRRQGETMLIFLMVQDPALPGALLQMRENRPVVVVYDGKEYNLSAPSPTDPAYIIALEAAGAKVHVAPYTEVGA
ncbi:MAG: DUF58 domain-containing protein [Fimbriimonadaceae bacterium]|nr:DUF58 domain-containing protein [Fimbriimonadaceae bacterium]